MLVFVLTVVVVVVVVVFYSVERHSSWSIFLSNSFFGIFQIPNWVLEFTVGGASFCFLLYLNITKGFKIARFANVLKVT